MGASPAVFSKSCCRSRNTDGGISVWKQDKPDLALTAYALSFLNDARDFVDVDPAVIASAEQFLLRGQTANGSWEDKSSLTAYLTLTLAKLLKVEPDEARTADKAKPIKPALGLAIEYLENHWSSSNDPYALAQIALASFQAGDEPLGAKTNAKLRTMIHHEGDSTYWAMETNTLFYEWGRAARTETTALVVQALALEAAALGEKDPTSEDRTLVEQGLSFLIHEKDGYGAWYSGQTTINVLDALLLLGKPQANLPSGPAPVLVNGSRVGDLKLPEPNEISAPLLLDLTKFVKPGQNRISIVNAGTQTSSAQAVAHFYIPWDRSSAKKEASLRTGDSDALSLRITYDRTKVQVDQEIHCRVHAERIGFRGYGMLLAEIGLPPGAVVDRSSLEKAMQEAGWDISQYEVRPDRLVVYLWAKAGGTDFEFAFRGRYEMNALTAPSVLYDYYNPDAQTLVQPTRIEVLQSSVAER
jgi:A-macroglobulin TED domain/A-macroglobulin receptor binding domain